LASPTDRHLNPGKTTKERFVLNKLLTFQVSPSSRIASQKKGNWSLLQKQKNIATTCYRVSFVALISVPWFSFFLKSGTRNSKKTWPGVDVIISIFCNFCRFSAKNWRFSQKNKVMIKLLQKLAVVRARNANFFAKCFGENIFRIITPVPGCRVL
jgi:hypothetical protein